MTKYFYKHKKIGNVIIEIVFILSIAFIVVNCFPKKKDFDFELITSGKIVGNPSKIEYLIYDAQNVIGFTYFLHERVIIIKLDSSGDKVVQDFQNEGYRKTYTYNSKHNVLNEKWYRNNDDRLFSEVFYNYDYSNFSYVRKIVDRNTINSYKTEKWFCEPITNLYTCFLYQDSSVLTGIYKDLIDTIGNIKYSWYYTAEMGLYKKKISDFDRKKNIIRETTIGYYPAAFDSVSLCTNRHILSDQFCYYDDFDAHGNWRKMEIFVGNKKYQVVYRRITY